MEYSDLNGKEQECFRKHDHFLILERVPAGVSEKRHTMENFQNYSNLVAMINPSKPHHVQSLDPFEFDKINYYLEDS